MKGKNIVIIAGPNGAGKTTFAREFLPAEADCQTFINADLIALGISPFQPEAVSILAGRIMLEMIEDCLRREVSFAVETTLSGRSYAKMIPIWKHSGYLVKIIFLELPSADLAVKRVADRVAQGGHDIPEMVIRRRFMAGRINYNALYKPLADSWKTYDSSGARPLLKEQSENYE